MQRAGKLKAEAFNEKKATKLLDGGLNMRVKKKGSNPLLQEKKSINLLLSSIVWCQVHLIYPHVLSRRRRKEDSVMKEEIKEMEAGIGGHVV